MAILRSAGRLWLMRHRLSEVRSLKRAMREFARQARRNQWPLAHPGGDLFVSLEDAGRLRLIRLRGPDPLLVTAAENDRVAPREHVQILGAVEIDVIDLRLRQEQRQLPFDRRQFVVAEQRLGAETRAIDDQRRCDLRELGAVREVANVELAAAQ